MKPNRDSMLKDPCSSCYRTIRHSTKRSHSRVSNTENQKHEHQLGSRSVLLEISSGTVVSSNKSPKKSFRKVQKCHLNCAKDWTSLGSASSTRICRHTSLSIDMDRDRCRAISATWWYVHVAIICAAIKSVDAEISGLIKVELTPTR